MGFFGGSGAVASVAGKTGTVTLDKNDVGLSNVLNVEQIPASALGALQAGRNKIINGAFNFWQRGTSANIVNNTAYLADRFKTSGYGSSVVASQQAFTLGQTAVPGEPRYFHRAVVTSSTGASNFSTTAQVIEGVRTFAGKTVTLSFYAKADASRTIAVEFLQLFGTGGSPSTMVSAYVMKKDITSTWAKYTVTAAIPSIAGKTIGTAGDDSLCINFWWDAGSDFNTRTASLGQQSGTFDIAMVQLEPGIVATDFDVLALDPAFELARCQRYCVVLGSDGSVNRDEIATGICYSTSDAAMLIRLPATMRCVPTIAPVGTWVVYDTFTLAPTTSLALSGRSSPSSVALNATVAGTPLTQFRPVVLITNDAAGGGSFLIVSAEL